MPCWQFLLLPLVVETVLVQVLPLPGLVLDLGLGLGLALALALALVLGLDLVLGLGLGLGLDLGLTQPPAPLLVLAPFVLDATEFLWPIKYGINETLRKCYIYFRRVVLFFPFLHLKVAAAAANRMPAGAKWYAVEAMAG